MSNYHLILLWCHKNDFSKPRLKTHILMRFFDFFGRKINSNIFKNSIFLINSMSAFDRCIKCLTGSLKKNSCFFCERVPPDVKNLPKNFLTQKWNKIYLKKFYITNFLQKTMFFIWKIIFIYNIHLNYFKKFFQYKIQNENIFIFLYTLTSESIWL